MVGSNRSAKSVHQADEIRTDTSEHINTLTSILTVEPVEINQLGTSGLIKRTSKPLQPSKET